MAITTPTEALRQRVTTWLEAHKAEHPYPEPLAREAAENFGLWETDIGWDGGEREFPPIWLVDAAKALYA